MKPIPKSVKEHISNAQHFLDAAKKFPPPTDGSVQILLLLVAWENITIADKELSAWADGGLTDTKLHKDHATKLKDAPEIVRVILGPAGAKAREITISTGHDLAALRLACQYGSDIDSKDVKELFARGWHTDTFRRALIEKIQWVEMEVSMQEQITNA
jgi:hypothetical protein